MTHSPSSEVPDTLLPVQFFDRTRAADSPEKRLIFAVLLDAILQLLRGNEKTAVDAERWIRDEIEDVPISFAAACEALGVEAENLARDLLSRRTESGTSVAVPAHPLIASRRRMTPLGRIRRRGVRSPNELGQSPRRARE
jgi:hypothetical protein